MKESVGAVTKPGFPVANKPAKRVAAQVKALSRSLCSLSSAGWKSSKGNMNRVVSGKARRETRKAGRAQSFGASEGASLKSRLFT